MSTAIGGTTREHAVCIDSVDMAFNVGNDDEVQALSSIDLQIEQGEFVSLIGPSGCGKSTMLRLIGDLLTPTSGSVSVFGKPAHDARVDQDYGMVFQHPGLFDWRRVRANIELPLELHDWSKADRTDRSAEMLQLVKLDGFGEYYPRQLSGGMKQRVSIARALSFSPRLLLMDEPFGALDEMTREHMQGELLRIWKETGTTVVFVTHSIPESAFLSNRVVVLSARPGEVNSVIDVNLGERTPDTREDPKFFQTTTEIREALRAVEGAV
ncbi:MAG: ABC transporter ATP-binding protein [Acidimicrobiales bacterium]|jgi:NitT/TauT family transport system ATP-binding protein|nr:nitrate ABC transporter ATP-binding protein [Acidimicrobiaceae bacterium]MDP6077920.1 ABC transporter ATP-binding protein [Acidimicrobiales bacterium]MDP7258901.1 ABC transporter ATP-binding protein [Acidimicrobiales bacterium]HCV35895.1 nitrate ABC transporter ATP-binding protein [Acidimicrobiaceae bacterium]HJO80636.1 ABC transporter ATP-binding protein [Acidimicrobiales bacterium]|tara:strand:+ start:3677 stop:4480 length:804 start_codon:yes stop_codon:yes gene_type:complete